MGFVEEALLQMKGGDYGGAAKTLSSHVDDSDLKPVPRISIVEWVGECYSKCDQTSEAALWYERAGKLALECKEIPPLDKKKKALQNFERAMDCYKSSNNLEGIRRISVLKYSIARPPA